MQSALTLNATKTARATRQEVILGNTSEDYILCALFLRIKLSTVEPVSEYISSMLSMLRTDSN